MFSFTQKKYNTSKKSQTGIDTNRRVYLGLGSAMMHTCQSCLISKDHNTQAGNSYGAAPSSEWAGPQAQPPRLFGPGFRGPGRPNPHLGPLWFLIALQNSHQRTALFSWVNGLRLLCCSPNIWPCIFSVRTSLLLRHKGNLYNVEIIIDGKTMHPHVAHAT